MAVACTKMTSTNNRICCDLQHSSIAENVTVQYEQVKIYILAQMAAKPMFSFRKLLQQK